MKPILTTLAAVFLIAGCGATNSTPVMKVDDLWAEREKSKTDFQAKYGGKEIVVAGVFKGDKREYDPTSGPYEEVSIYGSSYHLVHCQNDGKGSPAFQKLPNDGDGVAVKGKVVSAEADAYVELKPCTFDVKK